MPYKRLGYQQKNEAVDTVKTLRAVRWAKVIHILSTRLFCPCHSAQFMKKEGHCQEKFKDFFSDREKILNSEKKKWEQTHL